jgi:hypothetical protein
METVQQPGHVRTSSAPRPVHDTPVHSRPSSGATQQQQPPPPPSARRDSAATENAEAMPVIATPPQRSRKMPLLSNNAPIAAAQQEQAAQEESTRAADAAAAATSAAKTAAAAAVAAGPTKFTKFVKAGEARNALIHRLYTRHEFAACLAEIETALKESRGKSQYAVYVKALIFRQQGRVTESLDLFHAAVARSPGSVSNLKQVGRSLYLLGRHEQALEVGGVLFYHYCFSRRYIGRHRQPHVLFTFSVSVCHCLLCFYYYRCTCSNATYRQALYRSATTASLCRLFHTSSLQCFHCCSLLTTCSASLLTHSHVFNISFTHTHVPFRSLSRTHRFI